MVIDPLRQLRGACRVDPALWVHRRLLGRVEHDTQTQARGTAAVAHRLAQIKDLGRSNRIAVVGDHAFDRAPDAGMVTAFLCNDQAHGAVGGADQLRIERSEEHTSELQSLMRISYAVFCLKKKK